MKRVLIITYYWPPTGGSGVQRWVKFSKYLPEYGWQPVIYTPENPEQLAVDESLVKDIPSCTEVLKTRIIEPYEIYRKLRGKKEVNPINAQKKSLKQSLAVWLRGNLFIPDPRVSWVRPSVRFLKRYLSEHPVDAVVTTGPPQSMHLIGLGLKKALGIKWIVDFRDPWTEMFYFKHLGLTRMAERKHRKLEKEVLDSCDAIISVTPLVQADFRTATGTPVELVTNGFDEDDFKAVTYDSRDFFSVVHTGLFASDGNPLMLWEALSRKCASDSEFRDKLRIRLSGKVDREIADAIEQRGLGGNLLNLGYMPHEEVTREQREASVLILPLRREPEYRKVLPGKIFEYLAARRPVLGTGQEDGAAATLLKESGAGCMYDWDRMEPVSEFIDREWIRWKSGDRSPLQSDIKKYSRRELTRKLTEIL